jgi:NADH-quinone oxidoreductase subunit G
LGAGPASLRELAAGNGAFFEKLKAARHPLVVLGMGALARPDGSAVLGLARELVEKLGAVRPDWNGFGVLHTAAARVGGLDLGLVPGEGGRDVEAILAGCESGAIGAVYLLAADEIDTSRLGKSFVIYQGHHGDAGAHRADVVLPGAAYTEKNGTYVNTEGRVQLGFRATYPPGEAREDWAILRALSERLGKRLPYDTLGAGAARHRQPRLRGSRRAAPWCVGRLRLRRTGVRRSLRVADCQLLHDLSDQSRLADHGRVHGEPSAGDGRGVAAWRATCIISSRPTGSAMRS